MTGSVLGAEHPVEAAERARQRVLAWRAAERRAEEAQRAAQPEVRLRCARRPACSAEQRQAGRGLPSLVCAPRVVQSQVTLTLTSARLPARLGALGSRRQRTGPHSGPGAAAPPPASARRQHAGGAQPAAPLLQGAEACTSHCDALFHFLWRPAYPRGTASPAARLCAHSPRRVHPQCSNCLPTRATCAALWPPPASRLAPPHWLQRRSDSARCAEVPAAVS